MFTGIIQAVGEGAALEPSGGDLKLRIKTGELPLSDVQVGDNFSCQRRYSPRLHVTAVAAGLWRA